MTSRSTLALVAYRGLRTFEYSIAADLFGHERPYLGVPWYKTIVVSPERGLRPVDGLLTGWHEPEASHLLMLEAVAGRRPLEVAYRAAYDRGYLWHEFGDSHLLVPS